MEYIINYYVGTEYDVLFLGTAEPISHETDGSPKINDFSESLSNPYVFNTAISRARTLVVAVGNPILLLKIERCVTEKEFGGNKAKCWSNYLKYCLEKGTFVFNDCLEVSGDEKACCIDQIKRDVEMRLGCKVEIHQSLQQVNSLGIEEGLVSKSCQLSYNYTLLKFALAMQFYSINACSNTS